MNRRQFLEALSLSSLGFMALPSLVRADEEDIASALFPVPTNTGISGTIVIVGGGMAGATLAKYLRLWGGTGVKVTLIEKAPSYTSNIMSNKVLTGQMTLADLNYVYDTLKNHYGVQVVSGTVTGINSSARTVTLAGGARYGYERLVLAPGLEFDLLPGMSSQTQYDQLIPHAWQAGPQTQLLRDQLVSMANGADVVITIPKAPYRCPPGPYERACVVADWLARNKPYSQVVVLDANAGILVEPDNFAAAFNGAHGYTVDYRSGCQELYIKDVTNRTVSYVDVDGKEQILTAGVLNPIPPQRAPQWLADAGLYDPDAGERSIPVSVLSYESTRVPLVHVIGDASLTTQPKAGHIGNQQAKTCADAILRSLQNQPLDQAPVTNSACYTPITATTATWLSAVYQYDAKTGTMFIPSQHNGGSAISTSEATTDNYEDMQVWFKTLMADTFT